MDRPRWLDDEPEVLELLHAFVTKLDRKPAASWKRSPGAKVEPKRLPGLFRFDEASDRQWSLIKSLNGVIFDILFDSARSPFDSEYAGARLRLGLEAEDLLRRWLNRPHQRRYSDQWR